MDYGKITAIHFDHGHKIGIAVERNGVRRAVKVINPFAEEIDAEWRAAHPGHRDPA